MQARGKDDGQRGAGVETAAGSPVALAPTARGFSAQLRGVFQISPGKALKPTGIRPTTSF